MRHLSAGRKLKRTTSHRKALLRNLATSLFEHKKIQTTEAKAKELRPYAEQLITKAKRALDREKQGLLPDGQRIDVHSRRLVGKFITNKAVLQELFDAIAPGVADRPGGYTRIIKTGFRRGDAGRTAIIELVDWAAPQDGAVNLKSRRRRPARPQKAQEKPTVTTQPLTESDEEPEIADVAGQVEDIEKPPSVDTVLPDEAQVDKNDVEYQAAADQPQPDTEPDVAQPDNAKADAITDSASDISGIAVAQENKTEETDQAEPVTGEEEKPTS